MDFFGINLKANVTADGAPDLGTVGNPMGILYGESTSAQWGDLAEKYTKPLIENLLRKRKQII